MRNTARRLTKLEQTAQATAIIKDASSTLAAIEDACSDGRISEAAHRLWNYLQDRSGKRGDDQDALVQVVLQDPVLSKLSLSSLVQIRDNCKEMREELP
ncbi:MAG: hypothetical protein WBF13_02195 [Candidatus Zixiibacteriota bacterium]